MDPHAAHGSFFGQTACCCFIYFKQEQLYKILLLLPVSSVTLNIYYFFLRSMLYDSRFRLNNYEKLQVVFMLCLL